VAAGIAAVGIGVVAEVLEHKAAGIGVAGIGAVAEAQECNAAGTEAADTAAVVRKPAVVHKLAVVAVGIAAAALHRPVAVHKLAAAALHKPARDADNRKTGIPSSVAAAPVHNYYKY